MKTKEVINKLSNTRFEFSKTRSGAIDLELHIPEDKKEMCAIAKANKHSFNDAIDAIACGIKVLYDLKEDNKNDRS